MTQIVEDKIYLHKDLSYRLVGLCMEIHREYGCVHNERVYHNVLKEKLEKQKLNFLSKPRIIIYSKETGNRIGYYEPDFVVENKVILELKAKPIVIRSHEIQLSEYIKTSEYEVGYLINFGLSSLYFKRLIYTNDRKKFLSAIGGKK
jgi:GxxExxY protein